jgi:hypothetical protein
MKLTKKQAQCYELVVSEGAVSMSAESKDYRTFDSLAARGLINSKRVPSAAHNYYEFSTVKPQEATNA